MKGDFDMKNTSNHFHFGDDNNRDAVKNNSYGEDNKNEENAWEQGEYHILDTSVNKLDPLEELVDTSSPFVEDMVSLNDKDVSNISPSITMSITTSREQDASGEEIYRNRNSGYGNKGKYHEMDSQKVSAHQMSADGKEDSELAQSSDEEKNPDAKVILISGMSGAGRSHAANALEDMGWYVVDNVPPKILVPLVDMMKKSGTTINKLAAVIDVRSRSYFQDLSEVLAYLEDLAIPHQVIFLEASDRVLIKRYESVRRPHPLQQGERLIEGIKKERHLLSHLKNRADLLIDTSSLSIHELSTKLYEYLMGTGPETISVHIFSFGFKYGLPLDPDFVADVRFLPNPYWIDDLRALTGKDVSVRDYVLNSKGATEFLQKYSDALEIAMKGYVREDKHFVTIAIGCTGGQHRSVVMSEALADIFRARGYIVSVSHRELPHLFEKHRLESDKDGKEPHAISDVFPRASTS